MLTAERAEQHVSVSLYLVEYPPASLFVSLEEGLRSRIQFELHVYQQRGGILKVLGDKLVYETQISQEAKWDVFNKRFILVASDSNIHTYSSKESFISAYFALSDIPVDIRIQTGKEYYVQGRITLEMVKFLPPLNILSDIIPENIVATDWERFSLPLSEETG